MLKSTFLSCVLQMVTLFSGTIYYPVPAVVLVAASSLAGEPPANFPTVLDTLLGQVTASNGKSTALPRLMRPQFGFSPHATEEVVLPSHFHLDATLLFPLLRAAVSQTEFQTQVVGKKLARGSDGFSARTNELKTALTTVSTAIGNRIAALEAAGEGLPLAIAEKWKQCEKVLAEKRKELEKLRKRGDTLGEIMDPRTQELIHKTLQQHAVDYKAVEAKVGVYESQISVLRKEFDAACFWEGALFEKIIFARHALEEAREELVGLLRSDQQLRETRLRESARHSPTFDFLGANNVFSEVGVKIEQAEVGVNAAEAEVERLEKQQNEEAEGRRLIKEREEEWALLTADKILVQAVFDELDKVKAGQQGEESVLLIRVDRGRGGGAGVAENKMKCDKDVGWTEVSSGGTTEAGGGSGSEEDDPSSSEASSERPAASGTVLLPQQNNIAAKNQNSRAKIPTFFQLLKNIGLRGFRGGPDPVVFFPETIGAGAVGISIVGKNPNLVGNKPIMVNRDFVAGNLEEIWRAGGTSDHDTVDDGVRILRLDVRPVWLGWSAEDWAANQRREEVFKAKSEAPDQQKMREDAGRVEEEVLTPEEDVRKRLAWANLGPMFYQKHLRVPNVLGGLLSTPKNAAAQPAEVRMPAAKEAGGQVLLRTEGGPLHWTAAPSFLVKLENEQDQRGLVQGLHDAGFLANMLVEELEGSSTYSDEHEEVDPDSVVMRRTSTSVEGPHDAVPREQNPVRFCSQIVALETQQVLSQKPGSSKTGIETRA